MKHIFVVDDEQNIRDLIKKYLEKDGYMVSTFPDGLKILHELEAQKPDLMVLDINMPGIDGMELCKEIRKISEIPIIFVTARDDEFDRIIGLEIGGDDYMSKPFSPRELVVRIKNIFKRMNKAEMQTDSILLKDVEISIKTRTVSVGEITLKLTTKEYELFEFMGRNAGMPFTREGLIEKVWGYDYLGDIRVIDDLVKRLRKKLKTAGADLSIETVWGYGYKIEK
ncbi:response regulator transcription factor [Fusibacter sp. JL216-2]|uniref:response regulator transcription factor n=1 Tax=Fusibacter sp. JL216-2 TaxID=3071453 RepID=UPI003D331CC0